MYHITIQPLARVSNQNADLSPLFQLAHSRISALGATFEDIQRIISTATKARFDLRQTSKTDTKSNDPTTYQISRITTKEPTTSPTPSGDKLTPSTPDLPEFIIYETSYQRYPLLLALGAITRAPGGSQYRSFTPVTVDQDGTSESRQNAGDVAEVSVWIHLRTAMQAEPGIAFYRSSEGNGSIVTADDVPKAVWDKAVARRPDIGVLFEEGVVRKEVPANLRGKGPKGRARKGKGAGVGELKREGSASGSGEEEEEEAVVSASEE
jgi:hypothetical protein